MILKFENVSKFYGKRAAVSNVTMELTEGVYALLGENGAGKTTLMRVIAALTMPSEGKVFFDGEDIFALGDKYREILGYMAQSFEYYLDFTAREFLKYVCALKGVPEKSADERLRETGLWDEREKKIKKLSGGMKRRLGIAQALLNDPKVLILDEPTVGLDIEERTRFYDIVNSLSAGKIVILSTHIFSDAENIAENVIMMKRGALVRSGGKEALEAELEGKIWEGETEGEVRGAVLRRRGKYFRVYSESEPFDGAERVKPTLEDVYMTEGKR